MRATLVSLCPTQAATDAGRPALTPELLAATGARYSRSNDGLEAILSKIDPQNPDKSVDSIFKMIDFGHASIGDMAPVAIFLDGVTMWLAYHLWSLCPTAGGQESSTRYIRLSADNLPDPNDLGIPTEAQTEWRSAMNEALAAYERAIEFWEEVAAKNPDVTRIPSSLLNDTSEKAQKTVARMKRNYAFDRARYFLPAALKTNVMLVQSARAWVTLCQQLLSHPLPEPRKLGELIREELALVAPRLIKHAAPQPSFNKGIAHELQELCYGARADIMYSFDEMEVTAGLHLFGEDDRHNELRFADDLKFHDNRYGFVGHRLQMTPVSFGWNGVTFGDVRDLNRHRTGSKHCVLIPRGFYASSDQRPDDFPAHTLEQLETVGQKVTQKAHKHLSQSDYSAFYWLLLGAQLIFSHITTADKFIYEAELRTGVGAHYRYAKHLHDALELWYQKFPATRGLILEGSAEPE